MAQAVEPRGDRDLGRLIALGLVQGPAELLPVSSSAHLMLLRGEPGDGAEDKALDVALHGGSLLALLLRGVRPLPPAALIASAAPAAAAGYLLQEPIEQRLRGRRPLAAGLVAGAAALALADRRPQRRSRPALADAAWVGLAQAAALAPGVSRMGATLAAARARGLTRAAAAELGLRAGLPVLAGATLLKGGVRRRHLPGAAAAVASTLAARPPAPGRPLWPWSAYRCALAATLLWQDARR